MRGRTGLAALALVLIGAGAAQAEPLKIRGAWVAPLANLASVWIQKKDLAVHYRAILRVRADPLCRHAADDHGDRQ